MTSRDFMVDHRPDYPCKIFRMTVDGRTNDVYINLGKGLGIVRIARERYVGRRLRVTVFNLEETKS